MKSINQKKKAFTQEMENLKKENNLKEEIKPFEDILKKSVGVKKLKPTSR